MLRNSLLLAVFRRITTVASYWKCRVGISKNSTNIFEQDYAYFYLNCSRL